MTNKQVLEAFEYVSGCIEERSLPHNKLDDAIAIVKTSLSQPVNKMMLDALKPFLKYIEVNDNDTLSMLMPDNKILCTASGSWSEPAPVTLGDFRRLKELTAAPQEPVNKMMLDALNCVKAHLDGYEEMPPWGEQIHAVINEAIAAASAPVVEAEHLDMAVEYALKEMQIAVSDKRLAHINLMELNILIRAARLQLARQKGD